jgi:hypothetical protein
MHELKIIQGNQFERFASENNLEVLNRHGNDISFNISPTMLFVRDKVFSLPPISFRNSPSIVINLPSAVIRGEKLATIYDDSLLPSGYSHSFNWVEMNGFQSTHEGTQCNGPHRPQVEVLSEGFNYFLIGITSHFGHFFVDCLDRLLAIDGLVKDMKMSRFIVDEMPIPQVMQIIDLLGLRVEPSNFVVLKKDYDYQIDNLKISSLCSDKPAISLASFEEFRTRIIKSTESRLKHKIQGIYIGRRAVETRKVFNQKEVETYLAKIGIASFYPEDHDFEETAAKFNSAGLVVIVIGSSKFNLAMCSPGTKIICLAPNSYVTNSGPVALMVRQLCSLYRLDLFFCSCEILGEARGLDSDIIIDIDSLKFALRTLGVS